MACASDVRRLAYLVLFCLFLAASAIWLPAQSFDLDRGREAVVSLDGLWRFHPGDSPLDNGASLPLWAQQDFDDSGWKLLRSDKPWNIRAIRR